LENKYLTEGAKEILKPFLEERNLKLYDSELVKEDGNLILRVTIDNIDGPIDIDTLALANEYLSDRIDKYDKDMPEYMLEVSSPGAERVLKNDEEIEKSIEKYIHVETSNMVYEGVLKESNSEKIVVRINIKGRFKNQEISKNEIKLIRLAVKF
jgi:ribosome maturation factor RimP